MNKYLGSFNLFKITRICSFIPGFLYWILLFSKFWEIQRQRIKIKKISYILLFEKTVENLILPRLSVKVLLLNLPPPLTILMLVLLEYFFNPAVYEQGLISPVASVAVYYSLYRLYLVLSALFFTPSYTCMRMMHEFEVYSGFWPL